jgi:hypothetical protein
VSETRWRAAGVGAILAFLVGAYHGGADSYVRINDNLDGFVPAYRVLAREGAFGPLDQRLDPILGGLPRNSLPTSVNLGVLPYLWLEPIHAYVLNELLIRLVAFFGMLTLLRRQLLRDGSPLVVYGASLCFALLPFLAGGHMSIAGQPFLLSALLAIGRGRSRVWDWVVVGIFPLWSSLPYIGVFVLLGLGLWVGFEWTRRRRLPRALAGALLLMTLLYAGSEYRLLYQVLLDPTYVSNRSEYDFRGSPIHWVGWIAIRHFLFSQHHAAALQFPIVLGTLGLALGLAARDSRRQGWFTALRRHPVQTLRDARPGLMRSLCIAVGLAALLALGVGVYNWGVIQDAIQASGAPVFRMFNANRFEWFHPLLFGLAFAFALEWLRRNGRSGARIAAALLAAQLGWQVWSSDPLRVRREVGLTYREFYSPALFDEIRDAIGRPQETYHVVSFGLIPGIPLFNGFQTLDAFVGNYPLEYKQAFRRAIAGELARDSFLRRHYDDWGAHVHLYSTELGMVVGYRKPALYTRDQPVRAVEHVEIDVDALRDLGCDYVLSAVEIRNHRQLGLELLGVFSRDDSPWEIRLYGLEPGSGARS